MKTKQDHNVNLGLSHWGFKDPIIDEIKPTKNIVSKMTFNKPVNSVNSVSADISGKLDFNNEEIIKQ